MLEQLAAADQLTAEPRPTAPHVVSERLGHARVTMTPETYAHVLPNMQREAAATLGAILRRRGASRSVGLSSADSC